MDLGLLCRLEAGMLFLPILSYSCINNICSQGYLHNSAVGSWHILCHKTKFCWEKPSYPSIQKEMKS